MYDISYRAAILTGHIDDEHCMKCYISMRLLSCHIDRALGAVFRIFLCQDKNRSDFDEMEYVVAHDSTKFYAAD